MNEYSVCQSEFWLWGVLSWSSSCFCCCASNSLILVNADSNWKARLPIDLIWDSSSFCTLQVDSPKIVFFHEILNFLLDDYLQVHFLLIDLLNEKGDFFLSSFWTECFGSSSIDSIFFCLFGKNLSNQMLKKIFNALSCFYADISITLNFNFSSIFYIFFNWKRSFLPSFLNSALFAVITQIYIDLKSSIEG